MLLDAQKTTCMWVAKKSDRFKENPFLQKLWHDCIFFFVSAPLTTRVRECGIFFRPKTCPMLFGCYLSFWVEAKGKRKTCDCKWIHEAPRELWGTIGSILLYLYIFLLTLGPLRGVVAGSVLPQQKGLSKK